MIFFPEGNTYLNRGMRSCFPLWMRVNKIDFSSVRHSLHEFCNTTLLDVFCCYISILLRKVISSEHVPLSKGSKSEGAVYRRHEVNDLYQRQLLIVTKDEKYGGLILSFFQSFSFLVMSGMFSLKTALRLIKFKLEGKLSNKSHIVQNQQFEIANECFPKEHCLKISWALNKIA